MEGLAKKCMKRYLDMMLKGKTSLGASAPDIIDRDYSLLQSFFAKFGPEVEDIFEPLQHIIDIITVYVAAFLFNTK